MESKLARSLSLAGGAGAAPLKGTIELAELAFGDEIGHGAFSRVYRGALRGGVVAIKKITVPRRDLDRHLAGELALLSSPSMLHANLIRYHGVAIEPVAGGAGQIIHIVTEYMGGGDLRSVLKRRDVPLAWALRVRLARDVAAAVAHLHENELIHRDIKTENILLDDDWRCVLADYGFARKMAGPAGSAQAMTLCGTDEFMAPEILWGDPYSEAADIFSFGVVLWETMARIVPGSSVAPASGGGDDAAGAGSSSSSSSSSSGGAAAGGGFMARHPRTKFALDFDAMRGVLPADTPESLIACATECCAYEGEFRPTARDVVEWLTDLLGELEKQQAAEGGGLVGGGGGGGGGATGAGALPAAPTVVGDGRDGGGGASPSSSPVRAPLGTPVPSVITGRAAAAPALGALSPGPGGAGDDSGFHPTAGR